ncbi:MAG: hypothetical protein ACFFCQ_06695 [Promethearchaeota archaeon]
MSFEIDRDLFSYIEKGYEFQNPKMQFMSEFDSNKSCYLLISGNNDTCTVQNQIFKELSQTQLNLELMFIRIEVEIIPLFSPIIDKTQIADVLKITEKNVGIKCLPLSIFIVKQRVVGFISGMIGKAPLLEILDRVKHGWLKPGPVDLRKSIRWHRGDDGRTLIPKLVLFERRSFSFDLREEES